MRDRGPGLPMGCSIGTGRIGREEFRLAETSWDGSVLNATELLYRESWRGHGVVNALKGGLEGSMVQQDWGNHVEREVVVVCVREGDGDCAGSIRRDVARGFKASS